MNKAYNEEIHKFTDEELEIEIDAGSPADIDKAERVGYDIELACGQVYFIKTPKSDAWEAAKIEKRKIDAELFRNKSTLIINDDKIILDTFKLCFPGIITAKNKDEMLLRLLDGNIKIAILDYNLGQQYTGVDLIPTLKKHNVIIIAASSDTGCRAEQVVAGAELSLENFADDIEFEEKRDIAFELWRKKVTNGQMH